MKIGQYTPQAPIGTGHSTNKIETQKADNDDGESQNLKIAVKFEIHLKNWIFFIHLSFNLSIY